jgi:hypothetical protein
MGHTNRKDVPVHVLAKFTAQSKLFNKYSLSPSVKKTWMKNVAIFSTEISYLAKK